MEFKKTTSLEQASSLQFFTSNLPKKADYSDQWKRIREQMDAYNKPQGVPLTKDDKRFHALVDDIAVFFGWKKKRLVSPNFLQELYSGEKLTRKWIDRMEAIILFLNTKSETPEITRITPDLQKVYDETVIAKRNKQAIIEKKDDNDKTLIVFKDPTDEFLENNNSPFLKQSFEDAVFRGLETFFETKKGAAKIDEFHFENRYPGFHVRLGIEFYSPKKNISARYIEAKFEVCGGYPYECKISFFQGEPDPDLKEKFDKLTKYQQLMGVIAKGVETPKGYYALPPHITYEKIDFIKIEVALATKKEFKLPSKT